MIQLRLKKNIVLFSIDSRRQDLYSVYDGIASTPNLERMAKTGIVFNNMYSASASTVMSLSSLINGRWCHEFERISYPERVPHEFADTMFSDFEKMGRKNYILFSDTYLREYADGIYRGPHAERVRANYASPMEAAENIVRMAEASESPFCIYYHASRGWTQGGRKVEAEDAALGYLLDNLDLSDTTVVFYSDHGFLKGEHANLFNHAFFLYEQAVRVPCVISGDSPAVVNEVLSLAQLRTFLRGDPIGQLPYLYFDTQYSGQRHRITGVLDTETHWKYVAHYSNQTAVTGRQEELYDLTWDPGEHRNLLFDRAQHPVRHDWNLQSWWQETPDSNPFDDYDINELARTLETLRGHVAGIWVDGFLSNLSQIIEPNGKSALDNRPDLIQSIMSLESQKQLALVSNYFGFSGSPDSKNRPPEFSLGFPALPKNFLEYS
jgi:hypothetical protein